MGFTSKQIKSMESLAKSIKPVEEFAAVIEDIRQRYYKNDFGETISEYIAQELIKAGYKKI